MNRLAIILYLALSLIVDVFCVSTKAPLIEQDILQRCRHELRARQIPIDGLAVRGRDVILVAPPDSLIASPETQAILGKVSGVRTVQVESPDERHPSQNSDLEPAATAQQKELQEKIDRVLENQGIAFKSDSAILTPESESTLDSVASALAEVPNLRCEIRGFNSGTPTPVPSRQQMILALQRALATEDYLVAKGIAEWRLSTHAFKVGDNTDGRRVNRVVDLVVRAR